MESGGIVKKVTPPPKKKKKEKKGETCEIFGWTNNHLYHYLALVSHYEIDNKTILLITDLS